MTPQTTNQTSEPPLDESRVEAFAEKMLDVLNKGALGIMTSIGHRTGLFDIMARLPPSTSQQIADAARLNERYVREWLGAMVTGDIVSYDAEANTYNLPRDRAALLTRSASPDNLAAFTQYLAVLGSVEDEIVECFQKGGGVPYSRFQRFHQVMAEDSAQTVLPALTKAILPLVSGLPEALERGIDVLDVGCGSGRALNKMAKTFPNSRFQGYDLSQEAIATGIAETQSLGSTNIQFQVKDAATLDEIEQYDLITTFDAIHDQAKPDVVLRGIYNALRPDGTYLMQDIHASSRVDGNTDHPLAPFLYTISCMHCMTVSLAAGGMGLGAMWGEQKALEMLEVAGFKSVEIHQLDHDFQNNYYVVKKR
ncbi:MAG: methyltransferase domain-containing protein [Cyanobacteriota bacterium]|nr:methyltransferase domain-containing protein [Cyanobacteriota bacterium]